MDVIHVDDMGISGVQRGGVLAGETAQAAVPDGGLRALGLLGNVTPPDFALGQDRAGKSHADQVLHTHFGAVHGLLREVLIAQTVKEIRKLLCKHIDLFLTCSGYDAAGNGGGETARGIPIWAKKQRMGCGNGRGPCRAVVTGERWENRFIGIPLEL